MPASSVSTVAPRRLRRRPSSRPRPIHFTPCSPRGVILSRMPTIPECAAGVDDLDDLDVEDAFGHPASGASVSPVGSVDGPLDDEGDVDDLDV